MMFLKEFLANPSEVASVVPSSRQLADALLRGFVYEHCKVALEYGPGTGVFTRPLRERLPPSAIFAVAEPNPTFQRHIANQNLGIEIIPEYAQNIVPIVKSRFGDVDLVISGLPFSMMTNKTMSEIITATHTMLRQGGEFRLFIYAHTLALPKMRRLMNDLNKQFESVNTFVVWQNFPPATVIRCIK